MLGMLIVPKYLDHGSPVKYLLFTMTTKTLTTFYKIYNIVENLVKKIF
jgi:hypothetical protein